MLGGELICGHRKNRLSADTVSVRYATVDGNNSRGYLAVWDTRRWGSNDQVQRIRVHIFQRRTCYKTPHLYLRSNAQDFVNW